ncbi:MAG TPA: hypothetical protein VIT65_29145 [Microlunatus sp.]
MTTTSTSIRATSSTVRQTTYRGQVVAIMLAAFTLSVVHTVYAWLAGIADPGFTVTSPLAWIFYLVAFAVTGLALREERWAQLVVLGFLVLVLLIGVFYYPMMFLPHQQTIFGWFENDVYLGLLMLSFYLSIQRFRRVALVVNRSAE